MWEITVSVRETEVQSTVPNVLGRRKVFRLLLGGHGVPPAVPLFVAPYIIQLCPGVEDQEIDAADGDEGAVPPSVPRRVVCAVDVGGDHRAQLDEHVVQRGVDCAAGDGAGVARAPADLDRVRVWVGKKRSGQSLEYQRLDETLHHGWVRDHSRSRPIGWDLLEVGTRRSGKEVPIYLRA